MVPEDWVRVSTPPVKDNGPEKVVPVTEPFALVERREFWTFDIARLEVVALPCTTKFPVVVAPPEIVRPFACVPLPMVEEP